jgi:osmotically-inducible protein OsmY
MKYQAFGIVLLFVLATASASLRREQIRPVAPDNSRRNVEFRHTVATALTAEDQPNNKQDRLTAARIRRTIVADDTLSVYAHNVKIIVAGGRVTLEGPVHTAEERAALEFDAGLVVPAASIIDKVSVV